jgi:hypothetical protein
MAYVTGEIYKVIIDVIEDAVGGRLSRMPLGVNGSGGTAPAIFKVRALNQNGKIYGSLPFVVITSGRRDRRDSAVSQRYYDTLNNEVLLTTYEHVFTIGVYGGDAEGIAGDIEQYLNTRAALDFMREEGVEITDTFGVRPATTVLNGVAQDFASLNVLVTVNSTITQVVNEITIVESNLHLRYPDQDEDYYSSTIEYPEQP